MRETIDNLDSLKLNFCSAKDKVKRMRKQDTDWQKIFAEDTSNEGLLCKTHKDL